MLTIADISANLTAGWFGAILVALVDTSLSLRIDYLFTMAVLFFTLAVLIQVNEHPRRR